MFKLVDVDALKLKMDRILSAFIMVLDIAALLLVYGRIPKFAFISLIR